MPLVRFVAKLDGLFWMVWDDFSGHCLKIGANNYRNKPIFMPTLPLFKAYLIDDEFSNYLEVRDFFSGCPKPHPASFFRPRQNS